MEIDSKASPASAVRFSAKDGETEVGRAYLIIATNDLHDRPFGLMEDVFVDEAHRGNGYGEALVQAVVEKAREVGCYKLVATSRHVREKVHELYLKLGFADHGKEFRIDF